MLFHLFVKKENLVRAMFSGRKELPPELAREAEGSRKASMPLGFILFQSRLPPWRSPSTGLPCSSPDLQPTPTIWVHMKTLTKIAIAAGAVALATTAMAQPKPENFVKQRQSAFALIGWYFGPLGAVAKGENRSTKDDAVRAHQLSGAAVENAVGRLRRRHRKRWQHQGKNRKSGRKRLTSRKLPTTCRQKWPNWRNWPARATKLASKKQFGAVGGTCKAVTTTSANNNRQQL